MKKINLSEPNLSGNEKKYLIRCVDDNWVSSNGDYVKKFENKIKKITKSKFVSSCINGTSALHLGLKVLGVKKNDEVIVPTLTFVAPINAIIYNQANPVFMDVDDYFNIDQNKFEDFINNKTFVGKNGFRYNKKTKNKIAAIIPVHIFGNAVNINKILLICKKNKIKILEDASESLGTFYKRDQFKLKHTGTIGDAGVISFNGNKIATSGGGGIFLTKYKKYNNKFKYYANQAKDNKIYSKHDDVGYNYQMSNLNAALGLAQLEKLNIFINNKTKINNYYKTLFKNTKFSIVDSPEYSKNNYWLNILRINKKTFSIKKIIEILKKNNIESRPIWRLNHLQKIFNKYENYKINKANILLKNSLCLPSSSNLKLKDIEKIVKIICEI